MAVQISLTLRDGDCAVSFKADGTVTLRSGRTSLHVGLDRLAELAAIVRTLGGSRVGALVKQGQEILASAENRTPRRRRGRQKPSDGP